MFWDSLLFMTVVDLVIVTVALIAGTIFFRTIWKSPGLPKGGSVSIVSGLGLIALFYLFDLATMHILPVVVPEAEAMVFMKELHLEYNWPVALVAFAAIALAKKDG